MLLKLLLLLLLRQMLLLLWVESLTDRDKVPLSIYDRLEADSSRS